MATAILVAIALQVGLPHRGRVDWAWVFPVLELVMLGILIAWDPRSDRPPLPAEPPPHDLADRGHHRGQHARGGHPPVRHLHEGGGPFPGNLLGRGAGLWVTNVIVFSLWFWELDRGGPAERAAGSPIALSFAFPENAMPEFAERTWTPRYPDYLDLSFTNATAFSPTDTLPVKTWAKMAMMAESVVSLVTAILVVARAVNVLPG